MKLRLAELRRQGNRRRRAALGLRGAEAQQQHLAEGLISAFPPTSEADKPYRRSVRPLLRSPGGQDTVLALTQITSLICNIVASPERSVPFQLSAATVGDAISRSVPRSGPLHIVILLSGVILSWSCIRQLGHSGPAVQHAKDVVI